MSCGEKRSHSVFKRRIVYLVLCSDRKSKNGVEEIQGTKGETKIVHEASYKAHEEQGVI